MTDRDTRESAIAMIEKLRRRRAHKLRSGGRVTAIDHDGQQLRVVEAAHRGGKAAVTRIHTVPIPLEDGVDIDDPKCLGEWIGQALADARISAGRVVMGLPRRHIVFKPLALPPPGDFRELASMVHFQVGKDLPFPAEEAVIDFTVESHHGAGLSAASNEGSNESSATEQRAARLQVLAVAVRRNVIERYQAEASAAGLKLQALALRSYANLRCILCCGAEGAPDEALAFVNLRKDEIVVDVFVGEALAFSRVATDPTPDAIVAEVQRSLRSFQGLEGRGRVARILIGGDTGTEEAVRQTLADELEARCDLLDPASRLRLDESNAAPARASIAAIGLALSVDNLRGLEFDFLNPKKVPPRRNRALRRQLVAAALTIVAVVGGLALRSNALATRRGPHSDLEAQIASYASHIPVYNAVGRDAAAVNRWAASNRRWLDHWSYLSAVLPPSTEVYVTSLSTTASGRILITLNGKDGAHLAALHRTLREAGYGVGPMAVTPTSDPLGYGFKTSFELREDRPVAIDLADPRHQPPPRPEDDGSLDKVKQGGGS